MTPVVDQVGDAAHPAGHGGQPRPRPLGEGVGEGLGEGGEGVDVQGVVKAVGVGDPSGETYCAGHPQVIGQGS